MEEICAATGLRSTSTVHAHLKTLENAGYITREAGLNELFRLEGQVRFAGKATAGLAVGYRTAPPFASQHYGQESVRFASAGESIKNAVFSMGIRSHCCKGAR